MHSGLARCPQASFAGSAGMMKKMTYATMVIVRKRTIAHRIRRTRYWNIGLEVSHRFVRGRNSIAARQYVRDGAPEGAPSRRWCVSWPLADAGGVEDGAVRL